MNRITLLTALLCSVALLGCATPNTATPVSDVANRVQALLPLDTLLLGEQHDAPDHQRIQREVIETLVTRSALAAVVLEMAMQGNSTAGLGHKGMAASEDSVRAALKWDDTAWPWTTYSPAVMAAVRAGVPVMGANLPRAQMSAAMKELDLDQRLSGPALKAQQQLIRIGHCNLLPENQISSMTRIQIARDVAMANTLVKALADAAQPGKTVVLLAGSGHVDRRLGIPQHLPQGLTSKSVLLIAASASEGMERIAGFDVIWPTAAVPVKDYCAGLKATMSG